MWENNIVKRTAILQQDSDKTWWARILDENGKVLFSFWRKEHSKAVADAEHWADRNECKLLWKG